MLRTGLAIFVGISTVVTSSLLAQPNRSPAGRRGPGGDLPAVGSTLPDIKLYDDRGEQFSTGSLRGQYSVLVFGCLT